MFKSSSSATRFHAVWDSTCLKLNCDSLFKEAMVALSFEEFLKYEARFDSRDKRPVPKFVDGFINVEIKAYAKSLNDMLHIECYTKKAHPRILHF